MHSWMKLPAFARVARYSGRYRPACRIIHSGVRGVGCAQQRAQQQVVLQRDVHFAAPPKMPAMVRWIASAAARGSAASRIGRPTTM